MIFDAQGIHVAVVDSMQRIQFRSVDVEDDQGSDVGIVSGMTATDLAVTNPGNRIDEHVQVTVDSVATR